MPTSGLRVRRPRRTAVKPEGTQTRRGHGTPSVGSAAGPAVAECLCRGTPCFNARTASLAAVACLAGCDCQAAPRRHGQAGPAAVERHAGRRAGRAGPGPVPQRQLREVLGHAGRGAAALAAERRAAPAGRPAGHRAGQPGAGPGPARPGPPTGPGQPAGRLPERRDPATLAAAGGGPGGVRGGGRQGPGRGVVRHGPGRDAGRPGPPGRGGHAAGGRAGAFDHSAALRDAIGQLLVRQHRYAEAVDAERQATLLAGDDAARPRALGPGPVRRRPVRRGGRRAGPAGAGRRPRQAGPTCSPPWARAAGSWGSCRRPSTRCRRRPTWPRHVGGVLAGGRAGGGRSWATCPGPSGPPGGPSRSTRPTASRSACWGTSACGRASSNRPWRPSAPPSPPTRATRPTCACRASSSTRLGRRPEARTLFDRAPPPRPRRRRWPPSASPTPAIDGRPRRPRPSSHPTATRPVSRRPRRGRPAGRTGSGRARGPRRSRGGGGRSCRSGRRPGRRRRGRSSCGSGRSRRAGRRRGG